MFYFNYPSLKVALLASTRDDQFTNLKRAYTALVEAIRHNDVETIRFLHTHGVDVNQWDNKRNVFLYRKNPLAYALKKTLDFKKDHDEELNHYQKYEKADDLMAESLQRVVSLIELGATAHDDDYKRDLGILLYWAISYQYPKTVLAMLAILNGLNLKWNASIAVSETRWLKLSIEYGVNPTYIVSANTCLNASKIRKRLIIQYNIKPSRHPVAIPNDKVPEVLKSLSQVLVDWLTH